MMTSLERAARALAEWDGDPDPGEMPDGVTPRWKAYVPRARAVLTAIREPSEGMADAGRGALKKSYLGGGSDDFAKDSWQAMIDAALAEEGVK